MFYIVEVKDLSHVEAKDDAAEYLWIPLNEIRIEEFGLRSIRQGLSRFLKKSWREKAKIESTNCHSCFTACLAFLLMPLFQNKTWLLQQDKKQKDLPFTLIRPILEPKTLKKQKKSPYNKV